MRHVCHLPGCGVECPPAYLFCLTHWKMVPSALQKEIYRTVKQRNRDRPDASWAPWWRAQAEAQAVVMKKLLPGQKDLHDAALKEARQFAEHLEGR